MVTDTPKEIKALENRKPFILKTALEPVYSGYEVLIEKPLVISGVFLF